MSLQAPLFSALGLGLLLAAPAAAEAPDWESLADVKQIEVLTTNGDGSARETTIWLAVVEGQAYIRTSSRTRWGGNAERDPDIALRIQGTEYPLRASFVTDEGLRERIEKSFREKYGWSDGALDMFRGSTPRIMRLDPR